MNYNTAWLEREKKSCYILYSPLEKPRWQKLESDPENTTLLTAWWAVKWNWSVNCYCKQELESHPKLRYPVAHHLWNARRKTAQQTLRSQMSDFCSGLMQASQENLDLDLLPQQLLYWEHWYGVRGKHNSSKNISTHVTFTACRHQAAIRNQRQHRAMQNNPQWKEQRTFLSGLQSWGFPPALTTRR